jgi:aryl-alcohol dehydrogenase-like predicted oxidoreductase
MRTGRRGAAGIVRKSRGRTLLDLAFAWLLAQPTVASVIAGATRPEQIVQNVAAGAWRLSPSDAVEAARLASADASRRPAGAIG